MRGGRVKKANQSECGATRRPILKQVQDDPLFAGAPDAAPFAGVRSGCEAFELENKFGKTH